MAGDRFRRAGERGVTRRQQAKKNPGSDRGKGRTLPGCLPSGSLGDVPEFSLTTQREGFRGIGIPPRRHHVRWRLRRKVQSHIRRFSENCCAAATKNSLCESALNTATFSGTPRCEQQYTWLPIGTRLNAGQKKPGSAFGGRGRAARLLALRHIGGCPERSELQAGEGLGDRGSGLQRGIRYPGYGKVP